MPDETKQTPLDDIEMELAFARMEFIQLRRRLQNAYDLIPKVRVAMTENGGIDPIKFDVSVVLQNGLYFYMNQVKEKAEMLSALIQNCIPELKEKP